MKLSRVPTSKPSNIGYHYDVNKTGSLDYAPIFGFDVFDTKKNYEHRPQFIVITDDSFIDAGDLYLTDEGEIIGMSLRGTPYQFVGEKILASNSRELTPEFLIGDKDIRYIVDYYKKKGKMPNLELKMVWEGIGSFQGFPTKEASTDGRWIIDTVNSEVAIIWTETCTCKLGEVYNNLCCPAHGSADSVDTESEDNPCKTVNIIESVIVDFSFGHERIKFEGLNSKQASVLQQLIESHQLQGTRRSAMIPALEPEAEPVSIEDAARKYATNYGMMAYVFPEKKESFIAGAKSEAARQYWMERFKKM